MNDNVLELPPEAQRRLVWLRDQYQQAARLAQQGRFQEGITAFESCLDFAGREDFPLSVDQLIDILMRIALCHADLHQYDEALRYYVGIESLLNDWVEALESDGRIENVLKQNRSLPDWSPLLPEGVRFFIPQSFDPCPRLASVYLSRGNSYVSSGDLEQAIRDFTQAVELNPDDAVAYNNRAYVLRKSGEPERAIHDYTRALELIPTNADFFNDRGATYAELQQPEEALADYTRAIELDPAYPKAHYNRGNLYSQLSQYEQALADYTQTIEVDPGYAEAYTNRGTIYHRMKHYDEALADYTQALEHNPGDSLTYRNIHGLLSELDPADAEAFYNRGENYLQIGCYKEAVADFNQAIMLNSTYAHAYASRGSVHLMMQHYEQALADTTQAIELEPNHAKARIQRAQTYIKLERYQEALADLHHVLELDPDVALAHHRRGIIFEQQERYQEALSAYSRAIELEPTLAPAYNNRGVVYTALGQADEGLADYHRAIELKPDYAKAYFSVGGILYGRGELAEALHYFERAAELDYEPGAQLAAEVRRKLEAPEQGGSLEGAAQVLANFAYAQCGSRRDSDGSVQWHVSIEEMPIIRKTGYDGTRPTAVLDLHQTPGAIVRVTATSSEYTVEIMAEIDLPGVSQSAWIPVLSETVPAGPVSLLNLLDSFLEKGILLKSDTRLRYAVELSSDLTSRVRESLWRKILERKTPNQRRPALGWRTALRRLSRWLRAKAKRR